ncbi:MAG: DUF362 domain-containing protein [Verrucomicrobia bacterium]|nr:DUF362 domain-containing protein [Verrucomicrobiota bacterium]
MPAPLERGCFKVCRQSGRVVGLTPRFRWLRWLPPVVGLAALLWYLVRVLPKPSRAAYPCQQVAAPAAFGFLAYLAGTLGFAVALRRTRSYWGQHRFLVAGAAALVAALLGLALVHKEASALRAAATLAEHPRAPMGIARGLVLGRVAWAWDARVCRWNERNGCWWTKDNTDQAGVDAMASRAVQSITKTDSDRAAWEALFRHFNQERRGRAAGYARGEKIAIKINLNNDRRSYDDTPWINASPHLINALLRQLTRAAGVPESAIAVFDSSRYLTPHLYDYVHGAFPGVVLVDGYGGLPGRVKAEWTPNRITYAVATKMGTAVASVAVEADYLINLYIAKGHPSAGVTLSAKNHYGSVDGRDHTYISVKQQGYDKYNPLVELLGHRDLGGKTILNVCDMLYACYHSDALPIRWNLPPFNGDWPASLLMSQDPVAIDSVATDFLVAEFAARTDIPEGVNVKGKKIDMTNCDAPLHEAARADQPPSGIVYAPNGDGVRLKSLGVHEHWNNPIDKQYSRNLGSGAGIELVPIFLGRPAQ